MSSYVIPSLGPEKSQHLWELIKAKLASLNLYTDDVLSEYIMVLLHGGNGKEKIFEELVIFMNSPEIAEHFVLWLFSEVERLINYKEPAVVTNNGTSNGDAVNHTTPGSTSGAVSEQNNFVEDVQMSSGSSRLQGTRNFSKAIESAVATNSSRRSFSEDKRRDPMPSSKDDFDRSSRDDKYSDRYSHSGSRQRDSRDSSSTSRRVIRSSPENGGKIQKIKLSVDFNEDSLINRRVLPQGNRNSFKKVQVQQDGVETAQGGEGADEKIIRVKCQYWPNCRAGDACPNVHPTETCKHFPNCTFGDDCTFVHPSIPCKFQEKCQNPLCNYQHRPAMASTINPHNPHSSGSSGTSTIVCKFYPRCVNVNCIYLHPVKVQCRFGVDCSRADCPFEHAGGRKGAHLKSVVFAPCKYGKQCARADCPYQHEAVVGDVVSQEMITPVTPILENPAESQIPSQNPDQQMMQQ